MSIYPIGATPCRVELGFSAHMVPDALVLIIDKHLSLD